MDQAEAEFAKIGAAETKATETLKVAQAAMVEATASLDKLRVDLENAQTLVTRNVGTRDAVRQLESSVAIGEAGLAAAEAQVALALTDISESLPAQRQAAEAALHSAKVALAQTEVHSYSDGTVTQLALSVGSPASTLILSPAMVIIPDRPEGRHVQTVAGFAQAANNTIYPGMPAEIACDSNLSLSFRNAVLPARVVSVQPAISTGQVLPNGNLMDPAEMLRRGSILVYFELEYPEHEEILLDGSGCMVQTYTNNPPGFIGHAIAASGLVKAVGLRIKVWGSLVSGVGLVGGWGH